MERLSSVKSLRREQDDGLSEEMEAHHCACRQEDEKEREEEGGRELLKYFSRRK